MPTKPADWGALPKGEMLSIAEAAAIIGMSVKSLYTHYTGQKSLRPLPEGITLITKNGRAKYIVRTQEIGTMKSNHLNTVYVNVEMIGPAATEADVSRMIELLRERGWNAIPSPQANNLTSEHPQRQEYFDTAWAECLALL